MSLTEEILLLNVAIQQMTPTAGTAALEKTFAQLQNLFDQLKKTNQNNPRCLLAWNLLTYYVQSDLNTVKLSFVNTQLDNPSPLAKTTYESAFSHFIEQLDLAVSMLDHHQSPQL